MYRNGFINFRVWTQCSNNVIFLTTDDAHFENIFSKKQTLTTDFMTVEKDFCLVFSTHDEYDDITYLYGLTVQGQS